MRAKVDASRGVTNTVLPPIVLLHGLARTARSMRPVERALVAAGRMVVNIDYPSRRKTIAELAVLVMDIAFKRLGFTTSPIDVVTHSMGGILLRQYAAAHGAECIRRVVMLAPPNQGSEVVDALRFLPGFALWNGVAGAALGTDARSVPRKLGALAFEAGVIAGMHSPNPFLRHLLPLPNDGKVSVASARVDGMSDFMTVARSHTFLMNAPEVLHQVEHFLDKGRFEH